VAVRVFLDEDGDGIPGPRELMRFPGVEVVVGGRSGVTDGDGRALVAGVPAGSQQVSVRLASLPQFFEPAGVPAVAVPTASEVLQPVSLPVPGRRLHVYMASGDSISEGFGSSGSDGYRRPLRALLEGHWGAPAQVPYAGPGGGNSGEALERIDADLARFEPAWVLLQWGVNDWLVQGCQPDPRGCEVVQNLATLLERVRASGSLPVLATLTPVNVGFDAHAPESREQWVEALNEEIRALAESSGALLVDVHAAFDSAGPTADLFVDHVHPNDAGYQVIAGAYFRALTGPRP
jgi:lysophospholipase L1-like esterase